MGRDLDILGRNERSRSRARYYRGHLRLIQGADNAEVLDLWRGVVGEPRNTAGFTRSFGGLLVANGLFQEALAIERIDELAMKDIQIGRIASFANLGIGNNERAIVIARRVLELQPEARDVRTILASALSLESRYQEAEKELRLILKSEPNNRTALLGLHEVLRKSGEIQDESPRVLRRQF